MLKVVNDQTFVKFFPPNILSDIHVEMSQFEEKNADKTGSENCNVFFFFALDVSLK